MLKHNRDPETAACRPFGASNGPLVYPWSTPLSPLSAGHHQSCYPPAHLEPAGTATAVPGIASAPGTTATTAAANA